MNFKGVASDWFKMDFPEIFKSIMELYSKHITDKDTIMITPQPNNFIISAGSIFTGCTTVLGRTTSTLVSFNSTPKDYVPDLVRQVISRFTEKTPGKQNVKEEDFFEFVFEYSHDFYIKHLLNEKIKDVMQSLGYTLEEGKYINLSWKYGIKTEFLDLCKDWETLPQRTMTSKDY